MMYRATAASSSIGAQDQDFALNALKEGYRVDQRQFHQLRPLSMEFPCRRGVAFLRLGETQVMASVICILVEPSPFAPKQGFVEFFVHGDVTKAQATEVSHRIESLLKNDRAIDVEGLCVIPGRKVWSLRVDIVVVNDEGNVLDAALWATLVALQHFRRPELTIINENVTVHSPAERDPVPLTLHHIPIGVSCTILSDGIHFIVDPLCIEEAASEGVVSATLTPEGQLFAVHKIGGIPVPYAKVEECIAVAKALVPQVAASMKEALREDEAKRKAAVFAQFEWAQERKPVSRALAANTDSQPTLTKGQDEEEASD